MADRIRLRVITPRRVVVDEEVDEVAAPGALGEFGVLPHHIAYLTLLEPAEMSYKQGATKHYLAGSGGNAEAMHNLMTVPTPAAEYPRQSDPGRHRQADDDAATA